MNSLYLIIIILCVSGQSIVKRSFTDKTDGNGAYIFGAMSSLTAVLFFVFVSKNLVWDTGILPYAVLFASSYALSLVASVIATSCGPLSLTSLVISFSLMLPTLYGLIFLKDTVGKGFIPGIILLISSLVFINLKKEETKVSVKWIICLVLAFIGNGMCSVFQKMQQIKFDGAYKNEFMIEALIIVSVIFIVSCIIKERKNIKSFVKIGWHTSMGCGIMNGITNLFVMVLSAKMPVSVMFPLISAGGIVVTFFTAKFLFKEKLSKQQLIGFILGTVSVALLNI